MLKSCKYCMKIHDIKHICAPKETAQREYFTNISAKQKSITTFRSSNQWTAKRIDILDRDINMCQVCARKLYDTTRQFNSYNMQIHHIVPLAENMAKRLDDSNLITLCIFHHTLAESGGIPRKLLLSVAKEQEQNADIKYVVLSKCLTENESCK